MSVVERKATVDLIDEIAGAERSAWGWFIAAGVVEGGCLISFLLLMDFSNKEHWMWLVMALLIYVTLAFFMMAQTSHLRHLLMRVLRAVQLVDMNLEERSSDGQIE